MSGKGANPKEQTPCPKCGSRVQRRNMRKHERSVHQVVPRRRHVCPYCSAEKCRTYSTFLDWRNHLQDTHEYCLEDDDLLHREEYAAGFKLDRWDRERPGLSAHRHSAKALWPVPGSGRGRAAGTTVYHPPPHTKGTTPEVTLMGSERAGSDHEGSGQEEGEVTQAEGDEPGSFTQMKSRDLDSGSDDSTPGRDSWRSARGKETVMLTTPRPRGRGKRRMEREGGIAKRPRMESSSSECRDESEESRSGGARDRPGRGGRRVARPMTPPHRPPPPSISPRRSPRLTTSAVRDLRNLPLAVKTDRRTAHSRAVSGDEHGRGPSRSSRSSLDHGR